MKTHIDKNRQQIENTSVNEAKQKSVVLSAIKNQKYLVQMRGRHVITFSFEPELKDLLSYGPGTYTVMFTKPSFSFCKSIAVPVPKERIKLHEKQPLPKTPITPKKKSNDVSTLHEKVKEPQAPDLKPVTIISPYRVLNEPLTLVSDSQPKDREDEIIRCHHCDCVMDIISIITPSRIRNCEFCDHEFCSERCFLNHKCQTSYACYHCRKRFPKEYYIKNRFCGKRFCTLQCTYQCIEKNGPKDECLGCEDYIEEYEDGDLVDNDFERPEPEIECSYCDATDEDFDPGIYCSDCDEDEEFYCSWECFHEAHSDMGERHEGVRFEDLPDP